MTEEEKTEEYANEKCKECYMCSYSECENPYEECEKRQCRIQSYLAGLHEGQPKWHKVADGDLPKEEDLEMQVLCWTNEGYQLLSLFSGPKPIFEYYKVIAWCELPLFKE